MTRSNRSPAAAQAGSISAALPTSATLRRLAVGGRLRAQARASAGSPVSRFLGRRVGVVGDVSIRADHEVSGRVRIQVEHRVGQLAPAYDESGGVVAEPRDPAEGALPRRVVRRLVLASQVGDPVRRPQPLEPVGTPDAILVRGLVDHGDTVGGGCRGDGGRSVPPGDTCLPLSVITTLHARVRCRVPSARLQPSADPERGPAGPAEHLTPPETHGHATADGSIEVPLEVAVTIGGAVMEETPVQLHEATEIAVDDVTVDRTPRRLPHLAPGCRQAVRSLDQGEIPVLQHRARALTDVSQHLTQEAPSRDPAPTGECLLHARCGGTSRLNSVGEDSDGGEVVASLRGDVDHCLLEPHPGGPQVPLDLRVEIGDAVQTHTRGRSGRAVPGNRHMDQRTGMAAPGHACHLKCRLVAQRGRPHSEDTAPRPLEPGRFARVVEVDPGRAHDELAATHQASYVVGGMATGDQLAAGHDPGLTREHLLESIHEPTVSR